MSGVAARRRVWLGIAGLIAVAMVVIVVAVTLGRPSPATAMGAPRFVEEAGAAGIEHAYDGDWTYFVGGGVAAFDCDDDGRPELYLAGGTRSAALYRNDSPVGGALRFTRVPAPSTDLAAVTGAYPLDIDGDRHTDWRSFAWART